MRNLLSVFLALFILLSAPVCFAKSIPKLPLNETIVIGQVSNGGAFFVVNSNTLKNDLQAFISANQQAAVTFTQINIIFNAGTSSYYLIAAGTNQNGDMIKTTMHVGQNVQCLYVGGEPVTTCTTTSCASETNGCVPVGTACTQCANNGTCTKSVSNSPVVIFTSFPPSSCQ